MERYNSNARDRALNRTPNVSNLAPANMPSNDRSTSVRSVGTMYSIIQESQQTFQASATAHPVPLGVGSGLTANGSLYDSESITPDSTHHMIDLNIPNVPEGGDFNVDGVEQHIRGRKRKALDSTFVTLPGSSSSSNYTRIRHVPSQLIQVTPSNVTIGGISLSATPRTVNDFISNVRNTGLIPSGSPPENQLSIDIHGLSAGDSQLYSPTQSYTIFPSFFSLIQALMELLNGDSTRLQSFIGRQISSGQQLPSLVQWMSNSNFETLSFPHIPRANNSISFAQMQSLWRALIASSFQSTHSSGSPRITLVENSTHLMVSEQYRNFHSGISSALINQSNHFFQPLVTPMMMRNLSEFALRYQSNGVIQPSSGQVRYLIANGEEDIRRTANFLRGSSLINVIDPPPLLPRGIIVANNREMLLSAIWLALHVRMRDTNSGLKKNVISKLLKQHMYQSTKMNDYSDSCCVCMDTYNDGEKIGKIDCGHEFHYHCIRKWLKMKNSCPICRKTALTP